MEFLFPILIIGGLAVWLADLRQRGEPIGPAVGRAVRRWGPVLLVGYLAYTILGVFAAIVAIGFAFLMIWMIIGIFTGGFLWTDASATEAFNGFGIFIVVLAVAALVAFAVLMVLFFKMLFERIGDMRNEREVAATGPGYASPHPSPGMPSIAPPPPPQPPPPPPPPPVTARPVPARSARSTRPRPARQRPLRAPGR